MKNSTRCNNRFNTCYYAIPSRILPSHGCSYSQPWASLRQQQFMYFIILVRASSDLQDMTETKMSAAILDQPTQQKPKMIWGTTTGPAQSHRYHTKTSVKSLLQEHLLFAELEKTSY